MKNKGYIYVYTGDGKGKTTAATGIAIRAAGQGKKIAFLQFLKCGKFLYGEEKILKKIKNIKFIKFNESSPVFDKKLDFKKIKFNAGKHILKAINIINSGKYDLVILDEITYHFKYKTFDIKDFFKRIKARPESVDLLITGRDATKELIRESDLVTEMKKVKHPFDKGLMARKGIDY